MNVRVHKEMTEGVIRVRAAIRLLPTSESGRKAPIRGSYRPNHNFGTPDNRAMRVGYIDFPEGTWLSPGETAETVIAFWEAPGLVDELHPGREWRIQEGGLLVGIGTVIEVLSAP